MAQDTAPIAFPRRLPRAMRRFASSDGNEHLKTLLTANNPYYQTLYDDFVGAAVNTSKWAAVGGTGTPARAINSAANVSQMKLTTTTASADSCIQASALQWNGKGTYFFATLQLDVITTAKFEVGLSDSLTAQGMVNVKATPTANGTNFAVFCLDTTANANVDFMTGNAGTPANNGTWGGTFAAATNINVEVVVENGHAKGYINGQLVGSGPIATTAALTPWFYLKTLTTAARNLSVEAVACVGINHIS